MFWLWGLTLMPLALEAVRVGDDAEIEVLTCTYDGNKKLPTSHQEPERQMSKADWKQMGHGEPHGKHTQAERVASLSKVLKVALAFFEKYLPEMAGKLWLTHGALLGVVRSGNIIPWDLDLDISVDPDAFFTDAVWEKLSALNHTSLTSTQCPKEGCMGVPMPDDVADGANVILGLRAFDSMNWPEKKGYQWPGCFIDLETGFLIEILMVNGITPPKATETCKWGDMHVPVPEDPFGYILGLEKGIDKDKGILL
jgi:hypothetical protein